MLAKLLGGGRGASAPIAHPPRNYGPDMELMDNEKQESVLENEKIDDVSETNGPPQNTQNVLDIPMSHQ